MEEKVLEVIYRSIESVNQVLPREARLGKTPETALMGEAGELDSLQMVNLIVAIEQEIEDTFHVPVNLADDEAMSMKDNPFATIATLADYIERLLERKVNQ